MRSSTTVANGGKEAWAYIPAALYSGGDPNDTAHTPSPSYQLGALAFRRGGIPLYAHRFYVNATPRVWDVDFANTNTSTPPQTGNDWQHDPGRADSAQADDPSLRSTSPNPIAPPPPGSSRARHRKRPPPSKVLWEFTDANLGYVYDAPTMVKTYAYGWVVLVASGLQQPGRQGFPVRAESQFRVEGGSAAEEDSRCPSDTGTDADPTDLSTIRAFTASRQNPYALAGVRRRHEGQRVALRSVERRSRPSGKRQRSQRSRMRTGKAQPITTGVRIEIDQNNNVDRYLFVGTGKVARPAGSRRHVGDQFVLRDPRWHVDHCRSRRPPSPYSRSQPDCGERDRASPVLGSAPIGPRLVSGRNRRDAEDQLATPTPTSTSPCTASRFRRRTRASACCRRRSSRAISRRAIRCSCRAARVVASAIISGGIAGVHAGAGGSGRERRNTADPGPGHDDDRTGGKHSGQRSGGRHQQAPRLVGTR